MEIIEQGQKRNLSFNSNPSPEELKRSRHHSLAVSSMLPTFGLPQVPDCYSVLDLMTEIRKIGANAITRSDLQLLATKEDILNVDNKLVAQSTEISQLRDELEQQAKRLKEAEAKVNTRTHLPEARRPNIKNNGASKTTNPEIRKYNVVIEGVPYEQNDKLPEYVVEICSTLKMTVYIQDITDKVRLPRRDPHEKRPAPVLVTFAKQYIREGLLRKKNSLATIERFSSIFINPDETPEVRKRKAFFRRVAFIAKQDGKEVTYRHNWICIDDRVYRSDELEKIPTQYYPKDFVMEDTQNPLSNQGARPKTNIQNRDSQHPNVPSTSTTTVVLELRRPPANEKIRLTKSGLIFSGPTAFPSNLSPADFVFHKTPYTSTEQGYQHLFATHHLEFDIAEKIMKTTNTWDIKKLTENIVADPEWDRISPHKLYELKKGKYDQNPPLRKRLIETAPHRLVEGSKSKKWGGGAPFSDPIYDQGIVPGHNKFGDTLTRHRDELIASLEMN